MKNEDFESILDEETLIGDYEKSYVAEIEERIANTEVISKQKELEISEEEPIVVDSEEYDSDEESSGFNFSSLAPLAVGVATLAITGAVGFLVVSEMSNVMNSTVVSNPVITEITTNATSLSGALEVIPGWMPIIVITAIGGLLITLVSTFSRR